MAKKAAKATSPPKPKTSDKKTAGKSGAKQAPSFVEEFPADEATLETIRSHLRTFRDYQFQISDLDEARKSTQKNYDQLRFEVLPELFANARIDNLGLPPEGNNPGFSSTVKKYYRANIAASWDDDKRKKAFDWLEKNGGKDLIKMEINVSLPRGDTKNLKALQAFLKKSKLEFEVSLGVHSMSLTAFIKEAIEKRGLIPPLETLGASVGMIVDMKERK